MTKQSTTTAKTVNLQSGAQGMFNEGAAKTIEYSDYIPIIGGDFREVSISTPVSLVNFGRSFQIVGAGDSQFEDDQITWDDQGDFDNMANGETATVRVFWDLVDETGTIVEARTLDIEVRGTDFGPVFTNTETGEQSTDGLTFAGFTTKDELVNVNDFDPVKVVDIDLDLTEIFDVDLNAALTDLGDMGELALLAGKVEGLEFGASVARGTANEARALTNKIVELEGKIAGGVKGVASELFDVADSSLDLVEDVINGSVDFLEDVADFVTETVPNFFKDLVGIDRENTPEEDIAAFHDFDRGFFEQLTIDGVRPLSDAQLDAIEANRKRDHDAAIDEIAARNDGSKLVDFAKAQQALDKAEIEFNRLVDEKVEKLQEYTERFGNRAADALDGLADEAEAEARATKAEIRDKLEAFQERGLLTDIDSGARDVFDTLANIAIGSVKAVDDATFGVIDQLEARADLEVKVDAFAQAGLVVDFALNGGQVASDLDYDLTSVATFDASADTFTINALAENATTGEQVAFETASPSMTFSAGIAYYAGATFDYLVDIFVGTNEGVLDTSLDFLKGIFGGTTAGGTELVKLGPVTHTQELELEGTFNLFDFDSTEFEGEVPVPGFLGDILSVNGAAPSLKTEGKAAEFDTERYEDPGFIDIDELANVILDLVNMRLDFSPEMKAVLAKEGISANPGSDLGTAVSDALRGILATIGDEADTDGDGFVPIFQVTTGEKGTDGLIHLDTVTPDLSKVNLEDGGTFGFFVSEGASDNFVQVGLDVDQLITTAVNVAAGNTSQSTFNPLDLEIGIAEILKIGAVPQDVIDVVESVLTTTLNVQVADLDVRAGANFNQEFTLSVDDIDFEVVFEDGTTRQVSANEGGEIVIENASDTLVDVDGDGEIEYSLQMTPDATLFNDTELGLNVGYTMDFLKAQLKLGASLPLDKLFPDLGLDALTGFEQDFSLGPVLRLEGDLDLVTADVFEKAFDFDAGSAALEGKASFDLDLDVTPKNGPTGEAPNDDTGIINVDGLPSDAPVLAGPINGTNNDDTLVGTEGRDTIKAKRGDDVVNANGGNDKVVGGGGSDLIFGEAGRDKLMGGKGVDIISGGEGGDVIIGGKGDDHLQGDAGADVFKFAKGHGFDNIIDFEVGVDTIAIGRGAKGLDDLDLVQQGSTAVVSFANVDIHIDSVSVDGLLAADSFLF